MGLLQSCGESNPELINSAASASPDESINYIIKGAGSTIADNVDVSLVTITLVDKNDNVLVGVVPTFEATDTNETNNYGDCTSSNNEGVSQCHFSSSVAELKTLNILTPFPQKGIETVLFVHGPESKMKFLSHPTRNLIVGQTFPKAAEILLTDNFNNPIFNTSTALTLKAYTDEDCSILANGNIFSDVNPLPSNSSGNYRFTNLKYNQNGIIYIGVSSSSQLPLLCSNAITLVGDLTYHLNFQTQPSLNAKAGKSFSIQPIVEIRDQFDSLAPNSGEGEALVTLRAYSDPNCSIAAVSSLDGTTIVNANEGIASSFLIDYPGIAVVYIKATAASMTSKCSDAIIVTTGPASSLTSTITGTGPIAANGLHTSIVAITLKDEFGNPIIDTIPTFGAFNGADQNDNTYGPCEITDSNGISHCELTSLTAELKTLKIMTPTSTSGEQVLFIAPPDVSKSTIVGTTATADGVDTSIITVTLKDTNNLAVVGLTPVFSATDSNSTNIYANCSETTLTGVATCAMLSTKAETKTLSLTMPLLMSGGTAEFLAGAASASTSSITGSGPVIADGIAASVVTITLQDIFNNAVVGFTPTFDATDSSSTNIYSVCSLSNAIGVSTCNLKSTFAESKTLNMTAPFIKTGGNVIFSAGTSSKLVFMSQPTDTISMSNIGPIIDVEIRDTFDNLVNSNGPITISIGNDVNGGSSNLSGTLTKMASAGKVSFSDLKIDLAGIAFDLKASSGSLSIATSDSFDINLGSAHHLVFLVEPSNSNIDEAIAPVIKVEIRDSGDNLRISDTDNITLSFGADPSAGDASIAGTLTQPAVAGVASFNNISINKDFVGYKLKANSNALVAAISNSFEIIFHVVEVNIEQAAAQLDPVNSSPVVFDVTFSEAIDAASFVAADITNNGTSSGISWAINDSGDHINFSISATGASDGTITPSLIAGSVQTLALYQNIDSTSIDNIVTIDTIIPTVTLDSPAIINLANVSTYYLSGSCSENLQNVEITIGSVESSAACSGLTWSQTLDLSAVPDNLNLALSVDHVDGATNAAIGASVNVLKDTIIPMLSITSADNITIANQSHYSIIGTCSDAGEVVTVKVGSLTFSPLCLAGAFTTGSSDISGEADNPTLLISADLKDNALNSAIQTITTISKDTFTQSISIISASDISVANQFDYNVAGACTSNGDLVSINIGNLSFTTNCSGGTWNTGTVDVSSLIDNPSILITADHLSAVQASVNIVKNSTLPTVSISSPQNINISNQLIYIASGSCSEDSQIVSVTIDSLDFSPICSSGAWTTGQVDVSSISDGNLLITADHENVVPLAATTASVSILKDTATPTISYLSVATTLINSANITWTLVDPGGFSIDDYIINYRVKYSSTWLVFNDGVSISTETTVTGLLPSTIYEFRVALKYDTISQSEWSNVAENETKVDNAIFNSPYKTMNVGGATSSTVVALEDNTVVYHTPYTTGIEVELVNLNKGEALTFSSAQFDIIDGDKPIMTAGRIGSVGASANYKANITWQPTIWAGKSFSFNATRFNPQIMSVYAVENTTITVRQGTTELDTLTLNAGNGGVLSWSTYGSYQVNSTGIILAYHTSGTGGVVADPKPLLPAHTEIIGFPSNSMRITSDFDGTNYNLIHSDSVIAAGNLSKSDSIQVNPSGGSSGLYAGNSLIISADKNISGASFADSNGYCAAPFLPTNLMKKRFIINVNSDYVVFASKQAGSIDVLDKDDNLITTLVLSRTGSNPNAPYKVRRGTSLAGYRFISTVPVAAWYQPNSDTGGADEDETILYGFD